MARPKKTGLDYFPHDVDLSSDEKIEALEAEYGLEGYAIYLKLLERIYRAGGKLRLSEPETQKMLAVKLCGKACGNPVDKLLKIINLMATVQLVSKTSWTRSKTLTSRGIRKRVQPIVNKRLASRYKNNR